MASTDATFDRLEGEPLCKDFRLWIATNVGRRQTYESPLSKKVLNSVHRYLTGEFYYDPKIHGTALSPDVDELRHDLCIILANRGYETFEDIVAPDGGGNPPDSMVPPARKDADAETRPFRKNELRALKEAIDEEEDQRPSPGREKVVDDGE